MKALVKAKPEPGLSYEDVPMPVIGRGDVLIRVLRTGMCGTDLHIYSWDAWAQANVPVPLIVGHEFVGRIVELGLDVEELSIGDLVSGEGHLVCGRCRNCIAGRRVMCAHTKGIGVNRPGRLRRVHSPARLQRLAPSPRHRPRRGRHLRPLRQRRPHRPRFPVLGEDVLITGAGPIGIMAAVVARHAGARHVVITDVSEYRLELAAYGGRDPGGRHQPREHLATPCASSA